jgi:hypothetical protein
LDGKSDSEDDPEVDMYVGDEVDAPYCVDLDGDVDIERDGDDENGQTKSRQIRMRRMGMTMRLRMMPKMLGQWARE